MLVKNLLLSGALYTPLPLRVDGLHIRGSRFNFPSICDDGCCEGLDRYRCTHGFQYWQKDFGSERLIVCGYLNDLSTTRPQLRQRFGNHVIRDEKVREWLMKLQRLVNSISENQRAQDSLGPLHEINRWASQINNIAQRMLIKDKEVDFSANFDAASRDLKSLYKASSMMMDSFDYLNIFHNPSSAAFGKRRIVDLYKLVDKIRIILTSAEGASQNKKITIKGNLRCTFDLYESFKIIPFCLLQNAIKYSFDNEIIIHFSSNSRDAELIVESTGPRISDEDRSKIFERGYRGEWSKRLHHEGLGVGLYIAKIVAEAHGLEIKVRSIDLNYQRESIPVATNTFTVRLPIGSQIERRSLPR